MAEMASSNGLEPLTVRLEGGCSIQLSYKDSSFTIANPFSEFKETYGGTCELRPLPVL